MKWGEGKLIPCIESDFNFSGRFIYAHTHTKCFSHTEPYAIQTAPTRRPNGNFRVDVKVLNSMNLLLFTLLTIFSPLRSPSVSISHLFFMVCTFYLKTPLHFDCWWLAAGLRHEPNCVWMERKFSVAFCSTVYWFRSRGRSATIRKNPRFIKSLLFFNPFSFSIAHRMQIWWERLGVAGKKLNCPHNVRLIRARYH